MAKRTATTELTDRNWDQEEEPEEAGEFAKASDDAIKQRHIIKAKRKNPALEAGSGGAFSGFGGFSFKPMQASTPLLGFGQKTETKLFDQVRNDQPDSTSKIQKQNGEVSAVGATGLSTQSASATATSRSDYLSNLKALNNSVLEWITQHVRKNPYCILTPIFKDYEKHLSELEKGKEKSESNGSSSQPVEPQQTVETAKPKESELKPSPPKTGLTFGIGQLSATKTIGGPSSTTPFTGFGFNPTPVTVAPGSGFSFAVGTSKPTTSSEAAGTSQEEEEYVPPKPEVKEIEEEGSLYSKKCKLFYQKDGAWTERGVGHLHLKKLEEKTQLLVRADTNLGNILLNIMLSPSVPLQKQGKNNISMVCVPNPPVDPKADEQKPVPILIRVKTSDDADELLAKMNEMKN